MIAKRLAAASKPSTLLTVTKFVCLPLLASVLGQNSLQGSRKHLPHCQLGRSDTRIDVSRVLLFSYHVGICDQVSQVSQWAFCFSFPSCGTGLQRTPGVSLGLMWRRVHGKFSLLFRALDSIRILPCRGCQAGPLLRSSCGSQRSLSLSSSPCFRFGDLLVGG